MRGGGEIQDLGVSLSGRYDLHGGGVAGGVGTGGDFGGVFGTTVLVGCTSCGVTRAAFGGVRGTRMISSWAAGSRRVALALSNEFGSPAGAEVYMNASRGGSLSLISLQSAFLFGALADCIRE